MHIVYEEKKIIPALIFLKSNKNYVPVNIDQFTETCIVICMGRGSNPEDLTYSP